MTWSDATLLPSHAIPIAVASRWPDMAIEVVPTLDSTNAELMRRARSGHHDPVLLVARHQSAGRGRLGRPWHSGEDSLTFSLGLPFAPSEASGLSLTVGLSLAQSLHPDIMLKWPNDVWWHGRKLAGVLIETTSQNLPHNHSPSISQPTSCLKVPSSRYMVMGIGLNIGCVQVPGSSTEPAWLGEILPTMSAAQALACTVGPLMQTLLVFEQYGFAPFQTAFHARDALVNRPVTLSHGVVGIALGVDGSGALRVKTAHGIERVTSTEVSCLF